MRIFICREPKDPAKAIQRVITAIRALAPIPAKLYLLSRDVPQCQELMKLVEDHEVS